MVISQGVFCRMYPPKLIDALISMLKWYKRFLFAYLEIVHSAVRKIDHTAVNRNVRFKTQLKIQLHSKHRTQRMLLHGFTRQHV